MEQNMNYTHARKNLFKACRHYLSHNQNPLSSFTAKTPSGPDEFFYSDAIPLGALDPEFNYWLACNYYQIIYSLLHGNRYIIGMDFKGYLGETYDRTDGYGQVAYQGIKFLQGFEHLIHYNYNAEYIDISEPSLVLHNLQAFIDLFRIAIYKKEQNQISVPLLAKGELLATLLDNNAALSRWQKEESCRERIIFNLIRDLSVIEPQLTVGDILTVSDIQYQRNGDSSSFKLTRSNNSTNALVWNFNTIAAIDLCDLCTSYNSDIEKVFNQLIKRHTTR